MSDLPTKIPSKRQPLSRRARHVGGRRVAKATRAALVARFPQTFYLTGEKKPLALNIREMVFAAAPDLDREAVRQALRDYCGGVRYLREILVGAGRIDLDGLRSAGNVTVAQEAHARARLREILRAEVARVIGNYRGPAPRGADGYTDAERRGLAIIRGIGGAPYYSALLDHKIPDVILALKKLPRAP